MELSSAGKFFGSSSAMAWLNCSNTALSSAESAAKSSGFLASNKLLPCSSQSRVANVRVNRLGS
nr:MAG TPA: hypothetical protein [Bacteriophage sp.]